MKLAKEIRDINFEKFKEAHAKQKSSYTDYVNLPEEKEAHQLGDAVKASLTTPVV